MKGFYKMRLFAWVLPLALGLSACGSSSSSATSPGITPPDSSVTTVSYVLFTGSHQVDNDDWCQDANNIRGGGFAHESAEIYAGGWCHNWANLSSAADNPSAGLIDITAILSGDSGHEFSVSQFLEHSESIVSAVLIMNLAVECSGTTCTEEPQIAAVAHGIPLRIYLVDQDDHEVLVGSIPRLASDDSATAGQQYRIELDSGALTFLGDQTNSPSRSSGRMLSPFSLKLVGKSFIMHYGIRTGTDANGDAYPDVSPKLELVLKDYNPPDE